MTNELNQNQTATYANFVDQMTTNKVRAFNRGGDNPIRPLERSRNWSIQSFDFGHLLDPWSEQNVIGELPSDVSVIDYEALDDFTRASDAALLFSRNSTDGVERDLFVLRFGTEGFKRPRSDETWVWFYSAGPDGAWKNYDWAYDARIYLAIWLLNNPARIEREPAPADHGVNARLKLRNKSPLKATTLIHLTKPVYPASGSIGLGSSKRAHDRRGYSYVRKNGRTVHVPGPIRVKGGASTPPIYRVVR